MIPIQTTRNSQGGGGMLRPNVSHCVEENEVHYNPIPHDYSKDYLTFVALENNTSFRFTDRLPDYQLSYSLNNGSTWTVLEGDNIVTIDTGEKILWKGEPIPTRVAADPSNIGVLRATIDPSNIGVFASSKHFNAMGNIMSLAYSDDFVGNNTLPENTDFFKKLFMESYVVDAGNLVLPATVLTNGCYGAMFADCTSLETAPSILPATTLADSCYYYMFEGCTSLTTAPELPATTLASRCYIGMFRGCTSLATAPVLPATTLANECYSNMFSGCTSLTTAPELPAATLASNCYKYTFRDCTSLNSITCLATDKSATNCTYYWLYGVSPTGTFVKNVNASWTTGHDGIPNGWTVQDA